MQNASNLFIYDASSKIASRIMTHNLTFLLIVSRIMIHNLTFLLIVSRIMIHNLTFPLIVSRIMIHNLTFPLIVSRYATKFRPALKPSRAHYHNELIGSLPSIRHL